ncbi:MAG: nuclear transport factor 2 family protein [Steroidobacteraceae bacterium]
MNPSSSSISLFGTVLFAFATSVTAQTVDLSKLQNQTKAKPEIVDNSLIMIPSGKPDTAKEEANKRLVLAWHDDFWNKGNFQNWPKYMAADFRNHDPAEPKVGAQALVDWLEARLKANGKGKPAPKPMQTKLFLIADGDLVFISGGKANTDPNVDPARTFGGNIIRVENGKIVEWWYTGAIVNDAAAPAATPTTTP